MAGQGATAAADDDAFMRDLLDGLDDDMLAFSSQTVPPLRSSQKANTTDVKDSKSTQKAAAQIAPQNKTAPGPSATHAVQPKPPTLPASATEDAESERLTSSARKRKAEEEVRLLLEGLEEDLSPPSSRSTEAARSAPSASGGQAAKTAARALAPAGTPQQGGKLARVSLSGASGTPSGTPKSAHRPISAFLPKPSPAGGALQKAQSPMTASPRLPSGVGSQQQPQRAHSSCTPTLKAEPVESAAKRSASHSGAVETAASARSAGNAANPPRTKTDGRPLKLWGAQADAPQAGLSEAGDKGKSKARGKDFHGWELSDTSEAAVAQRLESRAKARAYTRAVVKRSFDGTAPGRGGKELLLITEVERVYPAAADEPSASTSQSRSTGSAPVTAAPRELRVVHLRDAWAESKIQEGDVINIIGAWSEAPRAQYRELIEDGANPSRSQPAAGAPQTDGGGVSASRAPPRTDAHDEDADLWDAFGSQELPSASQASAGDSSATITTITLSYSPADQDKLLIHHPDVLVPVTKVADGASCSRRAIIQDKLRATGDLSRAMLFGNMLHEVLQACLKGESGEPESSDAAATGVRSQAMQSSAPRSSASVEADNAITHTLIGWPEDWPYLGDFSAAFVKERVKEQVKINLDNLFALDIMTSDAYVDLLNAVKPFATFGKTYLATKDGTREPPFTQTINPEATVEDSRSATPATARIHRVLDVEEDIWSPMYGLKGKVDVSAEVEVHEADMDKPLRSVSANGPFIKGSRQMQLNPTVARSKSDLPKASAERSRTKRLMVVPLEIKTGKASGVLEHRAQTMLYTLLMGDRYGVDIDAGLLYYSKTGLLHRVRRAAQEVRGLILARNDIANYLSRSSSSGRRAETTETATFPPQADLIPPPIDEAHRCERCFANDGCTLYRQAHSLPAPETTEIEDLVEKKTGHLKDTDYGFFRKWDKLVTLEEGDLVKYRRELWTMTASAREKAGKCFSDMTLLPSSTGRVESQIKGVNKYSYTFAKAPNSRVRGSLLSGHLSANDPVAISIEPSLLSLAQGFITQLAPDSVTIGMDHSLDAALCRAVEEGLGSAHEVRFRIDRDELFAGVGKIRMNIAKLLFPGTELDERRRQLIVDLAAPMFAEAQVPDDLPAKLNDDQRQAVSKVLGAQDYALVLGMPGTGKTTTIAELIKLLVRQGKTILLTSYTHSAVDTIMRKLLDAPEARLLRLGNATKAHADLQPYTSDALSSAGTVAMLEMTLMGANVVGTTCLSLGHVIFNRRRFDYCIVDEASQVTLPTCLGPLKFADKFVLVGDHFQLPPLVRNLTARDSGLEESLFKRLSEAHPNAVASLAAQYRMNEDIMTLSNTLVYAGRLRCGSDEVSKLSLELPTFDQAMTQLHREGAADPTGWLADVLTPACKACFLDTDRLGDAGGESRQGDLVQNRGEAAVVASIINALLLSGVKGSDIAVITPYRQQIKLLTQLLHQHGMGKGVEVLTADKAQGRDKAVVLVSLVRSNAEHSVGRLLGDWRRINVAFTRAQRKLLVIGSQRTLGTVPIFRDFFTLMNSKQWVYALPHGAATDLPVAPSAPNTQSSQRRLQLA